MERATREKVKSVIYLRLRRMEARRRAHMVDESRSRVSDGAASELQPEAEGKHEHNLQRSGDRRRNQRMQRRAKHTARRSQDGGRRAETVGAEEGEATSVGCRSVGGDRRGAPLTQPPRRPVQLQPARHSPHHRIQSSAPLTTAKKAEARPRSIVAYCSSLFSALLCSSLLVVSVALFSARRSIPQVQGPAVQSRGGGINRVKHHLAGKGGDIEACRKVPGVVRHQFNQNIEDLRTKKRKTQEEYAESYGACDDVKREFDEIEHNEMRQ
ncbi:hypothetical protein AHAS_Ahas02G0128600 [Arachis hypogaea]